MNLYDLLDNSNLNYICSNGKSIRDFNVEDITRDTREVKKDSLFIAIIGENIDGHDLIEKAIENGASVIVHSSYIEEYNENVCYIRVKDTRDAMAIISKDFFKFDYSKIKFIGVTGTNGKTTSTSMMKDILEHCGNKVGLIGTISNYIGDRKIETQRTTPEVIDLFRLVKTMVDEGCNYCVLEVSSHAVALGRITGLDFERGMFTNLTQDHLDFHKTFENYYEAKFKFIEESKCAIINADDKYGQDMLLDLGKEKGAISYGVNSGYVRAKNIDMTLEGSSFDLYINEKFITRMTIGILGLYNIYNALGVIATLLLADYVTIEDIVSSYKAMGIVEGRCEKVEIPLDRTIIVDYAHTPDAVEKILDTMREVTKGKVVIVLGCGGNRDKGKRPIMGKIACLKGDIAIITSDNPRDEKPEEIIKDILVGTNEKAVVIEDRKEAIEYACNILEKEDILIIAGKGHENYQEIKGKKHHFSDKEVVEEYFNKK